MARLALSTESECYQVDAIIVELLHRVEADFRRDIARVEANYSSSEVESLLIECRALADEMRSLVAEARGAAMAADSAVADVIASIDGEAEQVAEQVGDVIDAAIEDASDTVDGVSEDVDALIELPEMLVGEPDSGPDRTPLMERKIFGSR